MFDEPTAHLDAATAHGIVDRILELADEGRGVLLISHDRYGLDGVDELASIG